ncbi:MetQ/NlpA family ABC transporter substrate-binding protein [Sporolactobacillus terrae]|uniref:MetQ/NlpA family ABC transporter substrate-binding protein n=1 Tax=Sporolactobacillus terrae TaxID=269673 RepID=UPI00048E499C|nr:MetQ/NlpA family ABC transporter substrate-binding protein [Sporolactobacillus terrae]
MLKNVILFISVFGLFVLSACSSSDTSGNADKQKLVVGTTPAQSDLWQFVKKEAAKKDLTIEIKLLTGQADLNSMLRDGDLDANSFQHIAYLTSWNKIHHTDLVPVGTTLIAPLGLYSKKINNLKELKDSAKIAIPNDDTNLSRALVLLQRAGLITLNSHLDRPPLVKDIKSNPHHYQIATAESAMLPRALDDVSLAAIINGTALDAGYKLSQSLFHENQEETAYINVIATTKTKVKEKGQALKALTEVYHSKDVSRFISEHYKGNFIPVTRSIEEVKRDFQKDQ